MSKQIVHVCISWSVFDFDLYGFGGLAWIRACFGLALGSSESSRMGNAAIPGIFFCVSFLKVTCFLCFCNDSGVNAKYLASTFLVGVLLTTLAETDRSRLFPELLDSVELA